MVELNATDKLWRYMDLDKYINMIAFKDIFMNSLSGYKDDTFENYCDIVAYIDDREKVEELFAYYVGKEKASIKDVLTYTEKQKWLAELFLNIQDATVVSCWHWNDIQSSAMWNLYASNPEAAVAIRTTYGKLRDTFKEKDGFYIQPVNYIDYSSFLPDAYDAKWYKRLVYSHEREVRIAKVEDNYGKPKYNPDGSLARTGKIPHLYPTDINDLVDYIYISPYANKIFAETVAAINNKYGIKCPLIFQDQNYQDYSKEWETPRTKINNVIDRNNKLEKLDE